MSDGTAWAYVIRRFSMEQPKLAEGRALPEKSFRRRFEKLTTGFGSLIRVRVLTVFLLLGPLPVLSVFLPVQLVPSLMASPVLIASGPIAAGVPSAVVALKAPTANAGGTYSGIAGVPLSLSGSKSTDPNGETLSYAWKFGDGATGTGATPSHTYVAAGAYTVTVTVTDIGGASASATTTAKIIGLPMANAGGPYSGIAGAAVSMSGSKSSDPNSQTLSYAWKFGDGATGTGATPSHTYTAAGAYTVTLTVTDSGGASASATATANIIGLPTANIGGPYSGIAGAAVSMSGAASTDPNGLGLTYAWKFGDSTTATGATQSHTYSAAGKFTVTLTVTDTGGAAATATATATIIGVPKANAGGPYSGIAGTALSLSGSKSTDPNGQTLSYAWNFGDSSAGTGATPTHTYAASGNYTITLTVTDTGGASATTTTTAKIIGLPTANPGTSYSGIVGAAVHLSGSASTDPNGLALSYAWNFGDSTTGTGATPSHTYAAKGSYTVTLKVTDSGGAAASAMTTANIIGLPTANTGGPYTGVAGTAVSLSAATSSDSNGLGLTYTWKFGDGTTGTGETPRHTYASAGKFTITLTVTDTGGAAATATTTATILALPKANAGGPYSATEGIALSVSGAKSTDPNGLALSYAWQFGDGTTGTGVTPSHIYAAPGSYTITLKVTDTGGASASATSTAKVYGLPTANPGGPYTTEVGKALKFNGSASTAPTGLSLSFAWNFGDGSTGTDADPSHTYTAEGSYNVTLTVTDNIGGSATATTTVSTLGIPTANPGGPYSGIVEQPVSMSAAASTDPNNLALSYLWKFGDGTTGTGETTTHKYASRGTHTITLIVTDTDGVTASATTTATILGLPRANAGGPYSATVNDPITLNGSKSTDPNEQALTYAWSFGDGSSGIGETPSHTYTVAGKYTIELTVTDTGGALGTTTTTAEVYSLPTANPGGPYTAKLGTAVKFNGSGSTVPEGAREFLWTFGDGATATVVEPTHTYAAAGIYTVTLTVSDHAGGSATATTSATISGGAISANAGGPYSGIAGIAVTMSGAGTTDSSSLPLTYAWNFGDGGVGTGVSPSHTYAAGGSYTVTLTASDGTNPPSTATTTAKILSLPTANAGGSYSGVAGTQLTLNGSQSTDPNGLAITSYQWVFGDGTMGTGVSPTHTYVTSGSYSVTLTVMDSGGASASASTTANILGLPTAKPSGPASGIVRVPVSFSGITSTDPNNLSLSYAWAFGDGTPTTTGVSPSHTYTAQGSYTITLTVTDTGGASASATTTINILGLPTVNPGGPYSGIVNVPVNFSSAGSSDPNSDGLSYQWNFGDGSPAAAGASVSHTYTAQSNYTVTLTVTDTGGASATSTTHANILGLPTANAGGPYTGTVGSPLSFSSQASTDPNGLQFSNYAWTFGDGTSGSGSAPMHTYTAGGNYTVTLTVTDTGGAQGSANAQVVISAVSNKPPIVSVGGPYVGQANQAVVFSSAGSSDQNGLTPSYSWTFGDGGTSLAPSPTHTYTTAGIYSVTLTVSDSGGATASAGTTANISAAPQPPIANPGGPYAGTTNTSLGFFGTNSSDPSNPASGGFSLIYSWTFGDGSSGSGPTPVHTYKSAGTFPVTLTVQNASGATGSASTSAVIAQGTTSSGQPTAISGGPYTGTVNNVVSFVGSGTDPNNLALTYVWTFGDGSSATTATASHTYTQAGTYSVALTVNNGTAQASAGTTATITGSPAAPLTANAGGPYTVAVNQPLQFNGSQTNNPNSRQLTYLWSFGDGTTNSGVSPTHIYSQMGSYNVGLTVSDGVVSPATSSTTATVTSPAAEAVTASAGGPYQNVVGQAVVFNGSGSVDNLGNALSYAWNFGDNSTGTGATPSHSYAVPGTYTVTLTATGTSANATATATVTIGASIGVSITSPVSNALFGTTMIQVTGTISKSNLAVMVNGVAATVSGTSFTASGIALREGVNMITATATDGNGGVGTGVVSVIDDLSAPVVSITSPVANTTVTSSSISVAGLVNDTVTGTIGSNDVNVTVNGIPAQVANRSYLLPNLQLVPGVNTITVVATDNVGNKGTTTETVQLLPPNLQLSLVKLGGDAQTGAVMSVLPQPLSVQLVAADGTAVAGRPITFTVTRSDGQVEIAPTVAQSIFVNSDANGKASVVFQLGSRSGLGINQVSATTPGAAGAALFTETSTTAPPTQIHAVLGQSQRGLLGEPLAEGLQVIVQDGNGNPIPGVTVNFTLSGAMDGSFDNAAPVTDSNGKAIANLTLGQQEGVSNYVVSADFTGDIGTPVTFTESAYAPGPVSATSVSGIVLDNSNVPVQNATVTLPGTNLSTTTDANGRFSISGAPVGTVPITVDGSTALNTETLPFLSFVIEDLPGQSNTLNKPIYLPAIDINNAQTVGGSDPVTLTMTGVPGLSFTVAPNSVTFPDGSTVGQLSISQVKSDMVPMEPTAGMAPNLIWTLQPAGTRFSVPVQVTLPNTSQLPPGFVTEIYQYDHDLEQFVSAGTAHVSADGSVLASDPGFGITKAGWGHGGSAPVPPTCPYSCVNTECTFETLSTNPCTCVPSFASVGTACGKNPILGQCQKPGTCDGRGNCSGGNLPDKTPCTPQLFCMRPGQCMSGRCTGTAIPEQPVAPVPGLPNPFEKTFASISNPVLFFGNSVGLGFTVVPKITPLVTLTEVCCEAKQALNVPKSVYSLTGTITMSTAQLGLPCCSIPTPFGVEGLYGQMSGTIGVGVKMTDDQCANSLCATGFITMGVTMTGGANLAIPFVGAFNANISGGITGTFSVDCKEIKESIDTLPVQATASITTSFGTNIPLGTYVFIPAKNLLTATAAY